MKKKLKEGEELRRVSQLDWKIIESDPEKTFMASGLVFVPLPVTSTLDLTINIPLLFIHIPFFPQPFSGTAGNTW